MLSLKGFQPHPSENKSEEEEAFTQLPESVLLESDHYLVIYTFSTLQ
jgi:hypothetical protein